MEPSLPLTHGEIVLRLLAAAIAGGVLGFEREVRSKPAGLRTHMLVALGAASFCLSGFVLSGEAEDRVSANVVFDPSRVVAGVIGGIGFLGAGTIIRQGGSIEGLTTAGSIWLTGALGAAAGAGAYWLTGVTTALALAIVVLLGLVERRVRRD